MVISFLEPPWMPNHTQPSESLTGYDTIEAKAPKELGFPQEIIGEGKEPGSSLVAVREGSCLPGRDSMQF